jgi:hypothetical protein
MSAPSSTTTTTLSLASNPLLAVAGHSSSTIAMGPGAAALSGLVAGPSGPVAGAVVHAERLVGSQVAAANVLTAADGTWTLAHVLGGRYRVRAWRSPDLDLVTPDIFFVADTGTKSVSLELQQFTGSQVTSAISPDPPVAGEPAELAVLVTSQVVDQSGIVRAAALSGASVTLSGGLGWAVEGTNPTVTDPSGRVAWVVVCTGPGPQVASVQVNTAASFNLSLPACVPIPPPTSSTSTTSPPPPSTTVPPTTSSLPGRRH